MRTSRKLPTRLVDIPQAPDAMSFQLPQASSGENKIIGLNYSGAASIRSATTCARIHRENKLLPIRCSFHPICTTKLPKPKTHVASVQLLSNQVLFEVRNDVCIPLPPTTTGDPDRWIELEYPAVRIGAAVKFSAWQSPWGRHSLGVRRLRIV